MREVRLLLKIRAYTSNEPGLETGHVESAPTKSPMETLRNHIVSTSLQAFNVCRFVNT